MLDQSPQEREDMFLVGDVLIDYSHQPGRSGGDNIGSPLISPDNNTAVKEPYKVMVLEVLDNAYNAKVLVLCFMNL